MKTGRLKQRVGSFLNTLIHLNNLKFRVSLAEEELYRLRDENTVLKDRIEILEQRMESLEPMVEKMVTRQIYYQTLSLQQRLDEAGLDIQILAHSSDDTVV